MRPQLISIPFSASVDESINAKIAPKGVFQKLENVYYTKSGQLVRRNGYDQIMQMGSSALYCGYRIGSNGDTKVQIRDTLGDNAVGGIATINLSSSATDIGRADDWERLGWLGAAGAIETRQAHARAEAEVLQCGVAQANGYLIYAWIDLSASTGQFRWRVENAAGVEIDSGALNYPTNPYGSGYLRIFRWGDKLCVGCFDTAQQRIEIFWWDTSNGQSNTWIVPTFDDVDAPPWDVVWDSIEDRLHIVHAVFFGENPDGTVLRKFRDDGGNNFTQTMYKTYATTATSGATLALNGDHSRLLVFWAGFDLWCASLSTAGYTYNSGVLTVDTANERTSLVCAPINDYSWICLSSAHVTSSGGIETETVLQSRVWSINASTMVETYKTLYGVRAASKFFARQASDYGYHHLIWMMYDCNNGPPWDDPDLLWDGAPTGQQRQWLLYQYRYDGSGAGLEDFELVGRAAYRTATGRMADIDQCTHVADLETSDGRWQWAAPEVFTGDVRLHEFTGVGTYTVTLSVWDRCQFADHGGLCISSSLPTYVGTRNLSEIGFLIAPDQLAEDHASGSSIPDRKSVV